MIIIKKIVEYLKEKRITEVCKYINGRLLDIGCGDNTLVRKYYPNGLGIDVVNYWRNVDLVVESSSSIPFADNSFDTITIVAALNHIPGYQATLVESFRLVKPGGQIIITMPIGFPQKLWHRITRKYDDDQIYRGINEEEERYYIPVKEIFESLRKVGFRKVKRKRFLCGLNNVIIGKKLSH